MGSVSGGKNNNAEIRMASYRAVTRNNQYMPVLSQKAWDAIVTRWNGLQRSQRRMVINTECKSNGHLYADTPLSDERSTVRMCRRCCAYTQEEAA
jgi:hypothetical protein